MSTCRPTFPFTCMRCCIKRGDACKFWCWCIIDRHLGFRAGLPTVALGLLEAWVAAHATRPSALKGMGATEVEPVPRWVDALLLVLDACTHIDWQAPSPEAAASAPQAPTGANRAAGPQAEQARSWISPANTPSVSSPIAMTQPQRKLQQMCILTTRRY